MRTEPAVRTYHFNPIRLAYWAAGCAVVVWATWDEAQNAENPLNWIAVGASGAFAVWLALRTVTIPFHRAWLTDTELVVRASTLRHPWLRTTRVPIAAIRSLWGVSAENKSWRTNKCVIMFVDSQSGRYEPRVVEIGDTLWRVWDLFCALKERAPNPTFFAKVQVDLGWPESMFPTIRRWVAARRARR